MKIFSLQKSRTFKIKLKISLTVTSLPGSSHLLSPWLINTIHLTVYHSDFAVCMYMHVFHHIHTHKVKWLPVICQNFNFLYL